MGKQRTSLKVDYIMTQWRDYGKGELIWGTNQGKLKTAGDNQDTDIDEDMDNESHRDNLGIKISQI